LNRGDRIQLEVEVLERRTARRFNIGWEVTVTVNDGAGSTIEETGTLGNLSSNGALLLLSRNLDPGTRVEVWIRVPFKRENWMTYSGEVVRSERTATGSGIALRFEIARPGFTVN
jgi:hypothetical protein